MKKVLSIMMVLLLALMIYIPVSAQSDPSPTQEPVVVEDEETPSDDVDVFKNIRNFIQEE